MARRRRRQRIKRLRAACCLLLAAARRWKRWTRSSLSNRSSPRGCAATARLPGLQGQGVRGGPLASVAPSPARVEWTLHRHEGPGTLLRPARAAGQGSVICYRVTVLHRRTSRTPQIGQEHRMRMGRPWCCRGGATAAAAEHAVLVHDGFFPPVCAPSASLGGGRRGAANHSSRASRVGQEHHVLMGRPSGRGAAQQTTRGTHGTCARMRRLYWLYWLSKNTAHTVPVLVAGRRIARAE